MPVMFFSGSQTEILGNLIQIDEELNQYLS